MAFTEFTCRSGGSNLYAGSLDGSAEASTTPLVTYTNGAWVSGTGVFTPVTGNPVSAGVAVGQWVSVYTDGSSAPTGFVGRVTAVSTVTITVSTSAKSGTVPTTGATGITLVVGGAWQGPNAAVSFPYGFVQNTMTDATGNPPRINFKNDQTYLPTSGITHANTSGGSVYFRGYTTTFGDGGQATVDGSTNAIIVLAVNSIGNLWFDDLIFACSATTGTNAVVSMWASIGSTDVYFRRCVFHGGRGSGLLLGSGSGVADLKECEFYANNAANTASIGQLQVLGTCTALRCIFHDGSGGNVSGVRNGGNFYAESCIFDTNGGRGVDVNAASRTVLEACDFYTNSGDGIGTSSAVGSITWLTLENCNFVLGGGYGINTTGFNPIIYGRAVNCGFGSGTAGNTSGQVNASKFFEVAGSVTYGANLLPWVDPANGDFRISLAAAKGTGRGAFTETAASYAGTVGYPDIGAAQHQDSGGAAGMLYHTGGG